MPTHGRCGATGPPFGLGLAAILGGDTLMANLKDQRIAILVANGFEQVELIEPQKALQKRERRLDNRLAGK